VDRRPLLAAIDRALDDLAADAFGILRALVAAPSTVGHEAAAQAVVAGALAATGFSVEAIPVPEAIARDPAAGVPQGAYAGRDNLLARRPGAGNRSLLIDGHIDVVPAETPELWASPPFEPEERDGWLYGRGAGDMKSGFAAALLAIRALDAAMPGWQHGTLLFLSAIEEECTGNGTLAAIRSGVTADAVLLPEPTDLDILIGGIGILWFEVTVTGRSSHALAADLAVNPIDVTLRLVAGLRGWEAELNAGDPDPALAGAAHPYNLNIGSIRSGDWQSSVPTRAVTGIRLGYPRAWTPEEAERRVRDAIDTIASGDPWLCENSPSVRLNGFRAEGYLLPADDALVAAVAGAHERAHGSAACVVTLPSTTDARFFLNQAGVPALCYGPRTRDIHGVDEAVELASVVDAARTIARFLLDFLGPAGAA